MGTTTVCVGICTYRRAEVVAALTSISRQRALDGVTLRVIVADNDMAREAEARVVAAAQLHAMSVTYVHAPQRNICVARNACIDAATGDFLAFLDDDETVDPNWMAALLAEADRSGCDAVLGPVKATYQPGTPRWLVAADLHSTSPTFTGGRLLKGYAGNVLIRRSAIARYGLRFDVKLGRTGGEDDAFFYQLTDAGGTISYAPQAIAHEPVAPGRANLAWLLTRSFRTGQTHGSRLAATHGHASRLPQVGVATAKTAMCFIACLVSFFSQRARNRWLVRGYLHAGVAARLLGVRELQLY